MLSKGLLAFYPVSPVSNQKKEDVYQIVCKAKLITTKFGRSIFENYEVASQWQ